MQRTGCWTVGTMLLTAMLACSRAPGQAAGRPDPAPPGTPPGIAKIVELVGKPGPRHELLPPYAGLQSGYPPELPGGKDVCTLTSPDFLKPRELRTVYCHGPKAAKPVLLYDHPVDKAPQLDPDIEIAQAPPTVDFLFYPGQTYDTTGWWAYSDALAANGKFYSAIGDSIFNAFVYEYDPAARKTRLIVDLAKHLNQPKGRYTPGRIQCRLDMGGDGWLYFVTTRGDARYATDQYHYTGDWILRHNPGTGQTETVAFAPAGSISFAASVLDPKRMILYAGTHPDGTFLAYDLKAREVLFTDPNGPDRYMVFAPSTGRVYYRHTPGDRLRRYDRATNAAAELPVTIGLRCATQETPDGYVYTVAHYGMKGSESKIFRFNTRTEQGEVIGQGRIGRCGYIATLDADPTGRYLYYVPGAQWDSFKVGSPLIQFDTRTARRKVIAFMSPTLLEQCGFHAVGSFGLAVGPRGEEVYITWNGHRLPRQHDLPPRYDGCGMTVVHVPAAERKP